MENISLNKIEIKGLSWKTKDKTILDNVELTLSSGHIYGVLGPNGAGKTSLVKSILRLIKGQSGYILYDGIRGDKIDRNDLAKMISFLPQSLNANVDFTAYDVIAMGREPYRKGFKPLDGDDISAIEEAIAFTNCENIRDKSICKLSGGELQRVMIARTIAQDTPWIILDEPISSLDIKHQAELIKVLNRLKIEKNKTIITILHDINTAKDLCDTVILMKEGRVALTGKSEEILTELNLKKIFDMEFNSLKQDNGKEYIIPSISLQ